MVHRGLEQQTWIRELDLDFERFFGIEIGIGDDARQIKSPICKRVPPPRLVPRDARANVVMRNDLLEREARPDRIWTLVKRRIELEDFAFRHAVGGRHLGRDAVDGQGRCRHLLGRPDTICRHDIRDCPKSFRGVELGPESMELLFPDVRTEMSSWQRVSQPELELEARVAMRMRRLPQRRGNLVDCHFFPREHATFNSFTTRRSCARRLPDAR